jgi:hypothetical protein
MEEFKGLGEPVVLPAVAVGERIVRGWQPAAVAKLVGVPYSDEPELDPAELAGRLDRFLAAAQRAICQVREDQLEIKAPKRDRTLRNLVYHIFRLSVAFVDCLQQNRLPEAWLTEEAPANMRTADQISAYGATVRERLAEWFKRAPQDSYRNHVSTYCDDQSVHGLLERTTWHVAQHLRQVYAFLEMMQITPDRPLDSSDFEGLPLPASLW